MTYSWHDQFALRWRRTLTPVLLALVFVFSQSLSLQHHHDNDLRMQVDCELCLKLGTSDDLLANHYSLNLPSTASVYHSLPSFDSPLILIRSANARAPPVAA